MLCQCSSNSRFLFIGWETSILRHTTRRTDYRLLSSVSPLSMLPFSSCSPLPHSILLFYFRFSILSSLLHLHTYNFIECVNFPNTLPNIQVLWPAWVIIYSTQIFGGAIQLQIINHNISNLFFVCHVVADSENLHRTICFLPKSTLVGLTRMFLVS